MCNSGNLDEPCDTTSILSKLKLKNVNRRVIGHLNISSFEIAVGKFEIKAHETSSDMNANSRSKKVLLFLLKKTRTMQVLK